MKIFGDLNCVLEDDIPASAGLNCLGGVTLDLASRVHRVVGARYYKEMIDTIVFEAGQRGYSLRKGSRDEFGLSYQAYREIEPKVAQKDVEQQYPLLGDAEVAHLTNQRVLDGCASRCMTETINALRELGYVFVPHEKVSGKQ